MWLILTDASTGKPRRLNMAVFHEIEQRQYCTALLATDLQGGGALVKETVEEIDSLLVMGGAMLPKVLIEPTPEPTPRYRRKQERQEVAHGKRLLRMAAVQEMTGKPKSTIYRDIRLGLFPESVKIGERAVAWRESDIRKWIEAHKTA